MNASTYLIINPFPSSASHGIHNYNLNLIELLVRNQISFDYFANDKKLSPEKFREEVLNYVRENYGVDEVIVEAPEVKAATLLLGTKYRTHIRLHTPGAVAQKYDGVKINYDLFQQEMLVLHQATWVSSPSYGLLRELADNIQRPDISVYKNPSNLKMLENQDIEKEYDLIFLGRFQKLKGIEYINPILERLPENYKVILLGTNSSKFKLSPSIKCNIQIIEEIADERRFDYVRKSRVLMQLSKFENCSMVILESLACRTSVVAWDVGGNAEIASERLLKIVPTGNIELMAYKIQQIIDSEFYPSKYEFEIEVEKVNKDFQEGFQNITSTVPQIFKGLDLSGSHNSDNFFVKKLVAPIVSHDKEYKKFGERIFAFSLSNEQIEEMWIPIINKFDSDYRVVCRRPLGFMYKFDNPYPVDKSKFHRYDWIKYPNILIDDIKSFKPHKILFHNGIHPMYKNVLDRVKANFPDIPIIYSELGWFPQQGNIYFDEWGTNGKSKMAHESFFEFCNELYPEESDYIEYNHQKHILIITQLENDTNLLVNSERFKKMENFITYILNEIGDKGKIIIKTHPLDKEKARFDKFANDTVSVMHEADLALLLKESKAVIGINSTVLMEALHYDTNVYAFGNSLLDNKQVVIECFRADMSLKEAWIDELYANRCAKNMILAEFKNRQINIESLKNMTLSNCLEMKSFQPLVSKVAIYPPSEEFGYISDKILGTNIGLIQQESIDSKLDATLNNKLESIEKKQITMLNQLTKNNVELTAKLVQENIRKAQKEIKPVRFKKWKKLTQRPYDFFNDSKTPIKIFRIFFKKHNNK